MFNKLIDTGKALVNGALEFGNKLMKGAGTAVATVTAGAIVLGSTVPARAEFTMPTEATGAFTDAATAAAALGAAAIAVVVAWQLGKMVVRGIRSFLG